MQISVTGRHLDIEQSLKDYIQDRLFKLEKISAKISRVHIILSAEKYRYIAEVVVLAKHQQIVVKEKTKDLFLSVEKALDKAERQLKKYRDLLKETRTKMP